MKFLKRKGDETTIRKVWNDDKTILYGVVGTVEDMLKVGLLEYCGYPKKGLVLPGKSRNRFIGSVCPDKRRSC